MVLDRQHIEERNSNLFFELSSQCDAALQSIQVHNMYQNT